MGNRRLLTWIDERDKQQLVRPSKRSTIPALLAAARSERCGGDAFAESAEMEEMKIRYWSRQGDGRMNRGKRTRHQCRDNAESCP